MSPPTTTPNWLQQRARLTPHRLALLGEEGDCTYEALERRVACVAQVLWNAGVRPGTHVGVLMSNGTAFATLVHALMRLEAILVPLNTRLAPVEIAWQVADADLHILLHDRAHVSLAEAARCRHCGLLSIEEVTEQSFSVPQFVRAPEIDLDAVHSIIYTSGTTGRPKGAMLTYGNHWWNATGSALNLGIHENDCWLACLPFFHVGGLSILLRCTMYGIPALIQHTFDPVAVNRALHERGVTIISVVSAMLRRLLDERGTREARDDLRCVLLGGGPAPLPLLQDCAARGIPVMQTYGLTECASQVATLAPEDAIRKLGSAGKPLFPMDLRIEREDGRLAMGEEGEIVVRGPSVMAGYFKRPEDTQWALRGDWLHTGDLGYLDEEGYLYVLDRRDDLIVTGGENVYPAEVESVLQEHEAVREAGVVGIPDERWGHVVGAVLVPELGASLDVESIIEYCRSRLARYKVPRVVKVVGELPRNPGGKLLRSRVREAWAQYDEVWRTD